MAKNDWQYHCANFLSQPDTSAAARRTYCEANGLNPNSFRRELANYSPAETKEKPAKKTESKAAPKPTEKAEKGDSQQQVATPKQRTDKQSPAPKSKGGGTTRMPKTQINVNTRPNVVTRPDGTRTFTKGNTAAMKHGGYADVLSSMDLEIDVDGVDLLDMGRLLKTRLLGMSKIRRDRINGVMDMYERGLKMTRVVLGPAGEEIHEPLTLIEALESVEYSGIEPFSRLVSQLVMIEEKAVTIERQRRDTNTMTKAEAVDITAELLQRRLTDELTAMETCHLFSAAGVEPPKLLLMEAEKELATIEPDGSNEQGVTDEELAAARARALANRERDEIEKRERQEWLNSVLAEAGQTGEVQVTDSSNDVAEPEPEDDDLHFLDGEK